MQDPLQPPALSEYEPEAKYELSTAAPALIGNRGSNDLSGSEGHSISIPTSDRVDNNKANIIIK